MTTWNVLLYSMGALFALKSLLSLMAQHKQHFEQSLHLKTLHEKVRRMPSPAGGEADLVPGDSPGQSRVA